MLNIPQVWTFASSSLSHFSGTKALLEPFIENYQKFNSNTGWADGSTPWPKVMQVSFYYYYYCYYYFYNEKGEGRGRGRKYGKKRRKFFQLMLFILFLGVESFFLSCFWGTVCSL